MRPVRRLLFALLVALTVPVGAQGSAGEPVGATADGVALSPEGTPLYATFSLNAIDRETGEAGVAVTTRVPFVGRAVPWVRAGVGAVATQSWTVVEYGVMGLDLLEEGLAPEAVLERLLADDAGRERRQVAILDMEGRSAVHTGEENGDWAGSRRGPDYTVQGNILVGPEVVDAVAEHFEGTAGTGMPLAERMILAMEVGQARGGDRRWGLLQSAAIRIADPRDPGRGGDRLSLSIDVGEHPEPLAEMRRIYWTTAGRLGHRSFSEIRGADVVELHRMLHALGYWRPELEEVPTAPRFAADPELLRSDPDAYQQRIDEFRALATEHAETYGVFAADSIAALDAFRRDHGLDYPGTPRGLVDERLVEALREAYFFRPREEQPAADLGGAATAPGPPAPG
jgi:uncharacterized Ntn-hydrolase superfamily protein